MKRTIIIEVFLLISVIAAVAAAHVFINSAISYYQSITIYAEDYGPTIIESLKEMLIFCLSYCAISLFGALCGFVGMIMLAVKDFSMLRKKSHKKERVFASENQLDELKKDGN